MQKQNNKYTKNPSIKICINIWIKLNLKKGDKSQTKIRLKTQIHEIQKYRFFSFLGQRSNSFAYKSNLNRL